MKDGHPLIQTESDLYGFIKPSKLVRLALNCSAVTTAASGASAERLRALYGASWMLARLRLRQAAPVAVGDALELSAGPLTIDGINFVRWVDLKRDGERIARCDLVFMVVDLKTRKIARPADVLGAWSVPPAPSEGAAAHKLRFRGEAEPLLELAVHSFDCDENGHLTSHRYIDYVCESAGYWAEGPKLAKELQVEFMSECLPGERLTIEGSGSGERRLLRGVKSDGRTAFCAACALAGVKRERPEAPRRGLVRTAGTRPARLPAACAPGGQEENGAPTRAFGVDTPTPGE